MNDFKGGKRFGGSRGGSFKKDGGSRPRFGAGRGGSQARGGGFGGESTLYKATCAECSKMCEVPFRPNGKKPVYCKDCFASMNGGDERRPLRQDSRPPRRDFDTRTFASPHGGKFEHKAPAHHTPAPDKRIDDIKQKLDALTAKLDTLIQRLESIKVESVKKPAVKKASAKKVSKKK